MSLSFAPIAAAPAAAALTGTPDEIGDRLIQSITGYEPLPEGGVLGDSSGPLTPGDLTELVGIDPADLPTDWDGGYLRMFATPRGDGYALATAGFESSTPTAWMAEGLIPYLSGHDTQRLFGIVGGLSSAGSRFGAGSRQHRR